MNVKNRQEENGMLDLRHPCPVNQAFILEGIDE